MPVDPWIQAALDAPLQGDTGGARERLISFEARRQRADHVSKPKRKGKR